MTWWEQYLIELLPTPAAAAAVTHGSAILCLVFMFVAVGIWLLDD